MKYRPKGSGFVRGVCEVEGCTKLQRYTGKSREGKPYYKRVCDEHHRFRYGIDNPLTKSLRIVYKKGIPNEKCSYCGWKEASCDRHRLDREKGYFPENVMVLCPNCHRLKHLGLLKEELDLSKEFHPIPK